MLAVLLPVLRKFGPYIVVAGLCFAGGCYAGDRFEHGAAEAAQLALVTQQKNDAAAVADANAVAAADLAQAAARANTAEAKLALENARAGSWETTLTSQIAAQAALPGKDAPDAPVLATTLDVIAKGQP